MTKALGINGDVQLNLFEGLSDTGASRQSRRAAGRVFIDPDPQQLYLGQLSVKAHLQAAGIRGPLVLRALLSELDWSGFEDNYARTGRAPYSPRSVLGLIVYGLLQGVSSLRGLERLARVDIGAMWVSGGICPDHANIGRFITQHDELLSGSFFIELTGRVLQATGSSATRVAGDGTVIEAACSHYGLIKEEAAKQRLSEARQVLAQAPEDKTKQVALAQSQQVHETLQRRKAARESKGKSGEKVCVSAHEPEAMVQALKRGRGTGPSYKPPCVRIDVAFIRERKTRGRERLVNETFTGIEREGNEESVGRNEVTGVGRGGIWNWSFDDPELVTSRSKSGSERGGETREAP